MTLGLTLNHLVQLVYLPVPLLAQSQQFVAAVPGPVRQPQRAELYNILAFHLTLSPATIPPALVACVLWVLVFLQYRESFIGILAAKPMVQE